jgi:hypothetical protein
MAVLEYPFECPYTPRIASVKSTMADSIPVAKFLEAIKAWVTTVEAHKPDYATLEAQKLKIFGKLLADDREFHQLFRQHLDGCSNDRPEDAINCVYAFFNAVADTTRPGRFRHHNA